MFGKIDIKKEFYSHFNIEMRKNKTLNFFYEILFSGKAYVVGGFFRDFLLGKSSRDIDVIVDLPKHILIDIIKNNNLDYSVNRHGGIKIINAIYNIDIWVINENWAFKNKLVKLNSEDQLNSIAKGCFYNYDSLVINLNNFTYNIKNFRSFMNSGMLDIMQLNPSYKNLNPSIEANILRAIFLNKVFGSKLSQNTYYYLYSKLGALKDKHFNIVQHLMYKKNDYSKYNLINEDDIKMFVENIYTDGNPLKQLTITI